MFHPSLRKLVNLVAKLSRRDRRPPHRQRTASFRPRLEALEDLIAPSTMNWISTSSGAWETASNWSAGTVPGSQDDVVINAPGLTITHSTDSTVKALTLSNGTLTGTGDHLIVSDLLTWTGGVMSGNGQTTADRAMTIRGTTDLVQRTLNNAGMATCTTGLGVAMGLHNGATLNNLAGATFDAQGTNNFVYSAGASTTFNNAGTFRKSMDNYAHIGSGIAFNNSGAVAVQSGTLDIDYAGVSSSSFTVAAGASLGFHGYTYTLGPTSSITGAGSVGFANDSGITVAGTYNISGNTDVVGAFAEADFTGPVVNVGALTVGGTGAAISFDTGTAIDLNAVTLNFGASLKGSDAITVNGLLSWSDSAIDVTQIVANGGMVISGSYSDNLRGNLTNIGTATWTGAAYIGFIGNGTTFVNQGTFDAQTDMSLDGLGYSGGFHNTGTFYKSAGTGTTSFGSGVAFTNSGTVEVQTGTVSVADSFTNAGTLTIDTGSNFTVTGTYTQTAGTTTLHGGTLTASNTVDIQGGNLAGSGNINANVRNAGELDPGGTGAAGVLTIRGDHTQTAAGVLHMEIGGLNPGSAFDQLVISGMATLDGTLNVSFLNGFSPNAGDSFQIVTFGARSGDFAVENGLDLGGGLSLNPNYDAASLTLVTIQS